MGYGSISESQARMAQVALDRASRQNGGDNPTIDVAAMMDSVGAGPSPLARAVDKTNPFIGGEK